MIKYDLIGYFISEADKNKKRYFKNLKTKEVFYHTVLVGYFDYKLRTSQNWLLVPKIPSDYKITYNYKYYMWIKNE